MSTIGKRRHDIDQARRVRMKELMQDYDEQVYYPARRQLMQECAQDGDGHNWTFTGLNPLSWPIFTCTRCGATEIKKE